jgi:hypothetical protein
MIDFRLIGHWIDLRRLLGVLHGVDVVGGELLLVEFQLTSYDDLVDLFLVFILT